MSSTPMGRRSAAVGADTPTSADRSGFAHKVPRGDGEHLRFFGMEVLVRASAESTGEAFTVLEEIDPIDVPPHVHLEHDELFYVLEGDHVFTVGDDRFEAGPGDLVFGPRGVPHAQRRVVARSGRILTLFTPAGFEGFFRELAEADAAGHMPDDFMDRLANRYGARWV